jgi:glycerophosphoryl diester phosphodiesterase
VIVRNNSCKSLDCCSGSYIRKMKRWFIFGILMIMAGNVDAQYIPRFDIQGHRGARGIMPENTIPAFIKALELGVTTVELDVVVTKDKKIVLSHEPWMSHEICIDSAGKEFSEKEAKKFNIYKLTYGEIAQFDCGSKVNPRFPQQQKQNVSKPLLQDVIIAIEDYIRNYSLYEVDYNIEIKTTASGDNKFHPPVNEFSDLVYSLLDQYLPMERIVIQSFDFRVLKYWHQKYPEVRLAALVENKRSIDSNLNDLGFKPSIYSPYYKLVDRDKVNYLHKLKIRVIPWTVNEESEMLAFKGMGVDGFITDYPDRARKYKMTLNIQRSK